MSDYFIVYVIFTYLYMGHRFFKKSKGDIPLEIAEKPILSGFIVTMLLVLSPLSFFVHLSLMLLKK